MKSGRFFALGLIAATAVLPAAASAESKASTRLQHCGAETCLLVTGHRSEAGAAVRIAGHDVAVEGGRAWHVALPLDTVRDWSAPFARSIVIETAGEAQTKARLPVGLLGHEIELAFLDVSARH